MNPSEPRRTRIELEKAVESLHRKLTHLMSRVHVPDKGNVTFFPGTKYIVVGIQKYLDETRWWEAGK